MSRPAQSALAQCTFSALRAMLLPGLVLAGALAVSGCVVAPYPYGYGYARPYYPAYAYRPVPYYGYRY